MKIVDYSTIKNSLMNGTRTAEHFGKFLGSHPHKLGLVGSLYKNLTASYLTESLLNVYTNDKKSSNSFQPINSMMFEWQLETNFIRKVKLAADVTESGANNTPVTMIFEENYYSKGDTFVSENRQMIFVRTNATRINDTAWSYEAELIDPEGTHQINLSYFRKGNYTRFRSNYNPELSEMGYSKYQSNMELHRNYISTHRASVSWSQEYSILEDVYIETATGAGKNRSTAYYKMNKKEKDCVDTFMEIRNNNLLWGKSNFDKNGKCTIFDNEGRAVPMGKLHCPLAA